MLAESDLRELLDYTSPDPVVSVYLNTDPSEGNADAYRLRLRTMLKDLRLTQDVEAIERYFDHQFDWSGRSVAVFSCAPQGFLRAYPLSVSIRSRIWVDDHHAAVKELADVFDAYGGYGVILVDKQGARLFHFNLGALREQEGVIGEEVKHFKRGGASSVPGRRAGNAGETGYDDEIVDRNMRAVADAAVHFFEEKKIRRVLLCGSDENVALLRGNLPKTWQSLIVGTFPMSMTATHTEVLNRAMEIGHAAEERRETNLIETAVTAAAKGTNGSIGIGDTLESVHSGRVDTLLVKEGYKEAGYVCKSCGYVTVNKREDCIFCGGKLEQVLDAVEMAVRQVLQKGGDVEIVHHGPALEKAGNIAAILRY
ncbi:MAG: hypothetical protein ABFD44_01265 [Anaerolineaceae bacterium]